jgi:hypothetical protein
MTTPNAPAVAVIPIFATPFAAVSLQVPGALNESLAALLASRATEERRDPDAPRDPLCYRSREDLFEWQDPALAALRQEMLAGLCHAVMASAALSEEEFDRLGVQARARFVIIRPDGCLPAAHLPLASWCAVYCVAAPVPASARADSATLRLYDTRLSSMFTDASNWSMRPPFAGGHHLWRPTPGHMAVFPACLAREIALNHSDRDLVLVIARVRFANPGQPASPPW